MDKKFVAIRLIFSNYTNVFIYNQNDSELFGRTIRVNIAKPQRIKEGSSKPVWSDDKWLQEHAGETLETEPDEKNSTTTDKDKASIFHSYYSSIQLR